MNIKPVLGNDKQTGMRRIGAAAVVLSFVSFVLVAMFDRGSLVGQLFFRDMTDTFMDYFNCLPGVAMRRPYDTQSMYPPLSEVVFYLFSKILPDKMLFEMAPRAMRTEQIPILSLMLYLAIPIAVTVIALSDYIKTGNAEKRLVIIAFLVSSPFIYLLERGNVLIYSFAAAVVFICYYDSDKKWQREMALIALAVSAGIKLYPAVLGILLVRDRRWKETIRCVIYGIFFFIAPFFMFGGLSNLMVMINALIGNSGGFGHTDFNCKINFSAIFNIIGVMWFGRTEAFTWGQTAAYVLSALLIAAAFLTKSRWKSVLFLTLVMIGAPAFSFYYTGVFMLLPFLWFIAGGEKEIKWTDIIYLLAFIAFLSPIPIHAWPINGSADINANLEICGVAILVMTLWGLIDSVIDLVSRIRAKGASKGTEVKA